MSAAPVPTPAAAPRREFALCLALLLALKAAGLALDPMLRFFMGDSASYFETAASGWIPPDRSFLYGWLLRAAVVWSGSLSVLLVLQAAIGIACALGLWAFLRRAGVSPRFAVAAAALLAIEPAQLFYERMMMAESIGLLAAVVFLLASSRYVERPRAPWLLASVVLGVAAVALRLNLLAVVLAASLAAPLVAAFAPRNAPPLPARQLVAHLALGAFATFAAHQGYMRLYGVLANAAPGYTQVTPYFRLGLVAPLLRPAHFEAAGLSPALLQDVRPDWRDPRAREAQIWSRDGLVDVVRRHSPDPGRTADRLTRQALRDDPAGLLRLGFGTLADYFDPEVSARRLQDDLGRRPPHARFVERVRAATGEDVRGRHAASPPATRWFQAGAPWLRAVLLLLAPVALLAAWFGRRGAAPAARALLLLVSLGLVANHVLFTHIVSFRYLHPLPWFLLANLALLAEAVRVSAAGSGRGTPSGAS